MTEFKLLPRSLRGIHPGLSQFGQWFFLLFLVENISGKTCKNKLRKAGFQYPHVF
jgi:hypothetical protein